MYGELRRMLVVIAFGMLVAQVWAQGEKEPAKPAPASPAVAATPSADAATAKKPADEENLNPLLLKYKQGGMTMWWLSFVSLVGVAFAIERIMQLRRVNAAPEGLSKKVDELWRAGKFDEVTAVCKANPSTLGRVVAFVVEHRKNELPALNEGIGDIVRREFRKHTRRAYPLAVVGTLSPLLGLFGTVVGLLEAFEAVAVAGSMDDPSILANSIAKALITTVYGLIIAMPALGAYHFFKTRTGDLLDTLDEEVGTLMNGWYLKK